MADDRYMNNGEMGWDDEIEHDSTFEVLPAGEYDFEVVKFERGRHTPGKDGKLPPCNKAVLTLRVEDSERQSLVTHNLFLHRSVEGMLCAFFTAIGQRSHGDKLVMNWNTVVGSRGRCKLGVRKWVGNDGAERESNQVSSFIAPDKQPATPQKAYKAGEF